MSEILKYIMLIDVLGRYWMDNPSKILLYHLINSIA